MINPRLIKSAIFFLYRMTFLFTRNSPRYNHMEVSAGSDILKLLIGKAPAYNHDWLQISQVFIIEVFLELSGW